MVTKTGKHNKRQYHGTKKRPALKKAKVSYRRIPEGVSVQFTDRYGNIQSVHSTKGENLHDYFFRHCDKKHLRDYGNPVIETDDQM